MLNLGTLAFAAPWALTGLLALPVVWWLLRLMPPMPARIKFPALRLLTGLFSTQESSARTPPWLMILRFLLAALLILASARPLIEEAENWFGTGPVLLVVDDGWASGPGWGARKDFIRSITAKAGREGRPVAVLTTTRQTGAGDLPPLAVGTARAAAQATDGLQPSPWFPDRAGALRRLTSDEGLTPDGAAQVIWLSDGLDHGGAQAFLDGLKPYGAVDVIAPGGGASLKLVLAPAVETGVFKVPVVRVEAGAAETVQVRALDEKGRLLARRPLVFGAGDVEAIARLDLPSALANKVARLDIENAFSAASVLLVDERWRRRPVGIAAGGGGQDLPLLTSSYYLDRALSPFTEVRKGAVADLLARDLSVMVMADPGVLDPGERKILNDWISDGGVLVRFAGPLLAKATRDGGAVSKDGALLPVDLRSGDRVIGGALSWAKPAALADFPSDSPFAGLSIPPDVRVARQVLARPSVNLADKTWAKLTDGTPLVTAEARGGGWLVLVHTTANTQWSNLPLSGLYVDMLRRLVDLSQGVTEKTDAKPLGPIETLDGFGRLRPAPGDVRAIDGAVFADAAPQASHPPGLYGQGPNRRALNLGPHVGETAALRATLTGADIRDYRIAPATDLRPGLLLAALILALVDFAASLVLRGILRPGPVAGALALGVLTAGAGPAAAQDAAQDADRGADKDDAPAIELAAETRLAYVLTGNPEVDELTRLGLDGLRLILHRRTAVELAPSRSVDPSIDELAFYPLIYWAVVPGAADLAEVSRGNINRFLRNGGNIIFDTGAGAGVQPEELARLARNLDIPPLVAAPPGHVIGRSFYLLPNYPGRFQNGPLFVERAGERVNDGVSPVVAGANGWAQAWALDERTKRPLLPVVPGGERQREIAFRFGVNLVMYSLTGNYKGDQVHLPEIIKRLGQ